MRDESTRALAAVAQIRLRKNGNATTNVTQNSSRRQWPCPVYRKFRSDPMFQFLRAAGRLARNRHRRIGRQGQHRRRIDRRERSYAAAVARTVRAWLLTSDQMSVATWAAACGRAMRCMAWPMIARPSASIRRRPSSSARWSSKRQVISRSSTRCAAPAAAKISAFFLDDRQWRGDRAGARPVSPAAASSASVVPPAGRSPDCFPRATPADRAKRPRPALPRQTYDTLAVTSRSASPDWCRISHPPSRRRTLYNALGTFSFKAVPRHCRQARPSAEDEG